MSELLRHNDSNGTAPTKNGTVENDSGLVIPGAIDSLLLPVDDGSYAQWQLTTVLKRAYFLRFYVGYAGTPTGEVRFLNVVNAGGTSAFTLRMPTSKKLKLVSNAGAKIGVESGVIEPNELVLVELETTIAESGNSKFTLKTAGSTLFTGSEGAATNEVMKSFRFGRPSSSATGLSKVWIGPVAVNDDQGASNNSFPGGFVAPTRRRVSAVV